MADPIRPVDDHDIAPWPTQRYDPHLPCPKCAAMGPGLEYRTLLHAAPVGPTGIAVAVREKLVITCWHCKYVWERLPLDTAKPATIELGLVGDILEEAAGRLKETLLVPGEPGKRIVATTGSGGALEFSKVDAESRPWKPGDPPPDRLPEIRGSAYLPPHNESGLEDMGKTKGRCGVCGAETTFTHHGVNAYACDTCHAHSLSHSGAENDVLVFRSIGDRLDRDIKVGGTD